MSSPHERHGAGFQVSLDYNQGPVVVFWEITKACALACRHCRAIAQHKRHPLELTTAEAHAVVDQLCGFQPGPILVISGGDPLMRRDLFDVAAYAVSKGLRTSLSPSVTALVTPKNLARAYEAGVRHISFSLDGATPEVHDGFRGVPGSFDRTLTAVQSARESGLTVQLNTTVSRWNVAQLQQLAEIVGASGAIQWDVFFLVPTGRAIANEVLSPEEHEEVFHWLYDLSKRVSYRVKTTLGQPFRRVSLQEAKRRGDPVDTVPSTNDGNGICFISHIGEVFPSGFLPINCGNVRAGKLVETYQTHPLFQALRDKGQLKGKCGACPYNASCGGCRARAYGMTGDYLAADPTCPYQPAGWAGAPTAKEAVTA
ncbi:MAG: radical SAM protein [Chloroflexi bacterium]|nr:radical SAM protein [Chloroflexota bacterium]